MAMALKLALWRRGCFDRPAIRDRTVSRGECLKSCGLMLRRWTCSPLARRIAPPRVFMAFAWSGREPHSARPARKTSLFGKPALDAGRDEKARSVVALSRVPRWAGFAGSPPAAGPCPAVNRPLVRIPANRHATTGTCEFGQTESKRFAARYKSFFLKNGPPFKCEWLNLT